VVYAKPPFGGAKQVFRYLGRYSHRVAIANSRLLALEDGQVLFRWKDYADDDRTKVMRLTASEFILLHVLPKRFVRIRHYDLLAGRNVGTQLARCRQLLGMPEVEQPLQRTWLDRLREWTGQDLSCCPRCQGPLTRQPLEAPPSSSLLGRCTNHEPEHSIIVRCPRGQIVAQRSENPRSSLSALPSSRTLPKVPHRVTQGRYVAIHRAKPHREQDGRSPTLLPSASCVIRCGFEPKAIRRHRYRDDCALPQTRI
jgi:hypothetical protein